MPSPDVATYLELELISTTAQELIDQALADSVAKFPDWEPREGNTEVVLLEQLAAMVEEDIHAVNTLPGALTEVLLRLFNIERDQGAPPSADVTILVADALGHTIPAGTTVRLDLGEDSEPLDLVTDTDLVIAPGQTQGTVSASGLEPTVEANGKPAGTWLDVLDAITYVNGAELATALTGGRVAEEGDAFLDRAIPVLSRLTSTLVRPQDIEAYVAVFAEVARVRVLDLYNPATPGTPPGNAPGFVTVAVAAAGGGAVATKATIAALLRNAMHAGLVVDVVDADVNTVDVTVTVLRFAAYDDATTIANVTAALTAYLDPDTWAWLPVVRRNELIAVVDAATGVDAVLSVDIPATDLTLTGVAPLAKAGTITVVVEAP